MGFNPGFHRVKAFDVLSAKARKRARGAGCVESTAAIQWRRLGRDINALPTPQHVPRVSSQSTDPDQRPSRAQLLTLGLHRDDDLFPAFLDIFHENGWP